MNGEDHCRDKERLGIALTLVTVTVAHATAVTLGDILLRRVPVALGACWSEDCNREAATKIGSALGWDQTRVHLELLRLEEERTQFLHPSHGSPADLHRAALAGHCGCRARHTICKARYI